MLARQALFRSVRAATRVPIASQARTFAAATDADVKPPVAVFGLDGTYATALVRPPLAPPSLTGSFFLAARQFSD